MATDSELHLLVLSERFEDGHRLFRTALPELFLLQLAGDRIFLACQGVDVFGQGTELPQMPTSIFACLPFLTRELLLAGVDLGL